MLAVCHYVLGGLVGLVACAPMVLLALGVAMTAEGVNAQATPLVVFGGAFAITALLPALALGGLAWGLVLAGRKLAAQEGYTFCFMVAILQAIFLAPLGTVLGVAALIVLARPRAKALFEVNAGWAAPVPRTPPW